MSVCKGKVNILIHSGTPWKFELKSTSDSVGAFNIQLFKDFIDGVGKIISKIKSGSIDYSKVFKRDCCDGLLALTTRKLKTTIEGPLGKLKSIDVRCLLEIYQAAEIVHYGLDTIKKKAKKRRKTMKRGQWFEKADSELEIQQEDDSEDEELLEVIEGLQEKIAKSQSNQKRPQISRPNQVTPCYANFLDPSEKVFQIIDVQKVHVLVLYILMLISLPFVMSIRFLAFFSIGLYVGIVLSYWIVFFVIILLLYSLEYLLGFTNKRVFACRRSKITQSLSYQDIPRSKINNIKCKFQYNLVFIIFGAMFGIIGLITITGAVLSSSAASILFPIFFPQFDLLVAGIILVACGLLMPLGKIRMTSNLSWMSFIVLKRDNFVKLHQFIQKVYDKSES